MDADTSYNIAVYTEQISTNLLSKSVDLTFTTKRSSNEIRQPLTNPIIMIHLQFLVPKLIRDIQIRRASLNTVVISWSSGDFEIYQLRYWSLTDENTKYLVTLLVNNFTLLTTTEHYKFQLRGRTRFGWSSYTSEKLISLRSMLLDDQFLTSISNQNRLTDVTTKFVENKNILLIGPLIILGLLVTVIILAFIYSKKYVQKRIRLIKREQLNRCRLLPLKFI